MKRNRQDEEGSLFTACALCLLFAAGIQGYRGAWNSAIARLVVALPCALLGKP
jgi:hypothetical protein